MEGVAKQSFTPARPEFLRLSTIVRLPLFSDCGSARSANTQVANNGNGIKEHPAGMVLNQPTLQLTSSQTRAVTSLWTRQVDRHRRGTREEAERLRFIVRLTMFILVVLLHWKPLVSSQLKSPISR
jgi:hypothetical protein